MINWMQRRQKYLVVVLWVTVIAFVGAGFVGWGSYKYGSQAGSLAQVGDIPIKQAEFQRLYSNIYGYYSQLFDGNLDDRKKGELQQMAINSLIDQALVLNLAKDLGIDATENEIAARLMETDAFLKEGTFDKATYLAALKNARIGVAEDEAGIRKEIVMDKTMELLTLPVTDSEIQAVAASVFMADSLEIKVLDDKGVNAAVSEDEVKAHWEANMNRYLGEPTFDIAYLTVGYDQVTLTDEEIKEYYQEHQTLFTGVDGKPLPMEAIRGRIEGELKNKAARKEALIQRLAWKKGEKEPVTLKGVTYENVRLPQAVMEVVQGTLDDEISKPIETAQGFTVVQVQGRNDAQPLPYAQARETIRQELLGQKTSRALEERAKKMVGNFSGKKIGFVSRDEADKIDFLPPEEASLFLNQLFGATEKEGYIPFGTTVVLYRVLEQKLFSPEKLARNGEFIKGNAMKLKEGLTSRQISRYLKDRYEIVKYYEGN